MPKAKLVVRLESQEISTFEGAAWEWISRVDPFLFYVLDKLQKNAGKIHEKELLEFCGSKATSPLILDVYLVQTYQNIQHNLLKVGIKLPLFGVFLQKDSSGHFCLSDLIEIMWSPD